MAQWKVYETTITNFSIVAWEVYKFGGASVKDANAVRNLVKIVKQSNYDRLCVVVSAMGKSTNALEVIWQAWMNNDRASLSQAVDTFKNYHNVIIADLFDESTKLNQVEELFSAFDQTLSQSAPQNPDEAYDTIVPFGELLSTTIISEFLNKEYVDAQWLDAREIIVSDMTFREGKVDWERTKKAIKKNIETTNKSSVIVTQGFIAGTEDKATIGKKGIKQVTLGREGSDYSAAIFAHCLAANKMTIWKDVPGVLNADPKYFSKTELLSKISFKEAIELSYYGATVIHPKTIKPLRELEIPLFVRSFLTPEKEGTEIQVNTQLDKLIPSYIFKVNQCLVSIQPRDFSFIVEENLEEIFRTFSKHRVKIHLMENSALSFTVCVDNDERLPSLIENLKETYAVRYNSPVELVTIRHYNEATIAKVLEDKTVFLEQKSRETARFVVN